MPQDILIVGCSIAGPTLATFLLLSPSVPAAQKPRITIVERSPTLRPHGQNVDVRGQGLPVVRKLGLEAAVRASTTGEKGVRWVDRDDRVWAEFVAAPDEGKRRFHSPTSEIEILRGRLAELVWRRSERVADEVRAEGGAGIEFVFGDEPVALEQGGDKVLVSFRKGEKRSFDLVVGADGLQSKVRSLVWGEGDFVRRLGMYAAFFSMPRAKTDSLWRRWFHASGRRGIMLRPDKQNDRTTALMYVVSDQDRRFVDVAKGPKNSSAQKDLMREYFEDAGWESERVIREMLATDDFYYDMVAQVKLDRYSKGRVVLLGDAGYCASPISGMGTTLALNGAYTLAGALTRHPHDHVAAFTLYEETIRPLVANAQKLVPGAPHIMNPETEWGVWVMHWIVCLLSWSGLAKLLMVLKGVPADEFVLEDYGFRQILESEDSI